MTATHGGAKPATDATAKVPINFAVFDARCAQLGALDESARAKTVGIDRVTLWRWRRGKQQPSLIVVSHVADTLGVSVDELTRRAA